MNDFKNIKGLGPKTIEYLEKLNIYSTFDLITHYPFRYEVLSRSNINDLKQDDKIIIDGIVESKPIVNRFRNMNKMTFNLNIKTNVLKVIIFNRAFMSSNIDIGKNITVIGKYDLIHNTVIANDILFINLTNKPTIIPIYRTTQGLPRKKLSKLILSLLDQVNNIDDYIPEYISNEHSFISKSESIKYIHNPIDIDLLKQAMIRLKYEELFIFMIKINYLKIINKNNTSGYNRKVEVKYLENIINSLPFELTIDQLKSLEDITKDLNSNYRMNRLLQGDVGSGKTIVAFLSCYLVAKSNYQSAFMAPTELLAKQHYNNALKLFKDIKIELLIGSTNKKEKEIIYKRLKEGDIDLIIGTHALLQESLEFNSLGLIITDEQHRFGVNQRKTLRNKGNMPDVLYMSATPIPRTYALTIYGDMDISTIKTLPKNKKEIITYVKDNKEIKEVLSMIKNELDNNHQIYVVAPLIEDDNEKENIKKLKDNYTKAFKDYSIEMLHGKMKQDKKDSIMKDFLDKKIEILIATTLIEVGIDVPNATMMVIHDADMFGLSTLHQLRGRVGRSDLQSYCILIGSKDNERLHIMESETDGFKISEKDFELRGSGDLFGIRQSGDLSFKIADIRKDFKILLKAKEDSLNLLSNKDINDYPLLKKEIDSILKVD
ncbi:MAG: ATP-dependent DNA helicase RecG [Tenericutes bacterium]|nr:ATP-dependent DNA helicase RecG [Mycoplasmatota bacterium]